MKQQPFLNKDMVFSKAQYQALFCFLKKAVWVKQINY